MQTMAQDTDETRRDRYNETSRDPAVLTLNCDYGMLAFGACRDYKRIIIKRIKIKRIEAALINYAAVSELKCLWACKLKLWKDVGDSRIFCMTWLQTGLPGAMHLGSQGGDAARSSRARVRWVVTGSR